MIVKYSPRKLILHICKTLLVEFQAFHYFITSMKAVECNTTQPSLAVMPMFVIVLLFLHGN